MSGHIVRAFIRMSEHRTAIRHVFSHECFKVRAYSRVCIFTKNHRGTGVLNKHMTQAGGDTTLTDCFSNILRNVAGTSSSRMKLQGFLINFIHFQRKNNFYA